MNEFIKKHLAEILRPFAEHVDELHQSVDNLAGDLENTEKKATNAHEKLEAQQKQLQTTRADLDKTNTMALATKAGLEKTNSEKALLEASHAETKEHLTKTHNRLLEAVAHLEKLQRGFDETNSSLNRTQLALSTTQKHLATEVERKQKQHEETLANHESALAATSKLLADTKRFSENSHDEFKAHVEAREKLNRSDRERFEKIDDKTFHMSTMLTETINRLNTHANHLRSTNSAIRPMQEKVNNIERFRDTTQKEQKEQNTHLANLQQEIDSMNAILADWQYKFKDMDPNFNVAEEIKMLKANLAKANGHIGNVQTAVEGAHASLPVHERRLQILEHGKEHHSDQLSHIQKIVGVDKQEIPQAPPLPAPSKTIAPVIAPVIEPVIEPVATPEVTPSDTKPQGQSLPKKIVKEGPSLVKLKFQDVVSQMSIKERQKQFKERFEQQQSELQRTNTSLEDINKDIQERMGPRMRTMETNIAQISKDVNELKLGMDLTEEYWKGLSRGFRETHKGVAIDRELVSTPRSASGRQMLPALARTSPPVSSKGSARYRDLGSSAP